MATTSTSATTTTSSKKYVYRVYKSGNNTEPLRRALNSRGWEPVEPAGQDVETANFVWKPTWNKAKPVSQLLARQHTSGTKRQVWNHLKAIEPLCTKDSLFETMKAYYTSVKEEPFTHLPPTFLVEPKLGSEAGAGWPGWTEFAAHFAKCDADPSLTNLWLAKPTSANRGIGIEVFSSLPAIREFLESKARGASMGIAPVWVLQKYIENPLLFRKRKFDFRVWVLAMDNGDVYMHAPGYVRTSSEIFDLKSDSRYAHLTNYCQQINADSFGQFEEGNTLTFADIEDCITEMLIAKRKNTTSTTASSSATATTATTAATASSSGKSSSSAAASKDKPVSEAKNGTEVMWGCGVNGLWGQMRSVVIDTFEALRGRGALRTSGYEENGFARKPPPFVSVPPKGGPPTTDSTSSSSKQVVVGPSGSRHRFELMGLDFMADTDFKIHFIEVNTNPSLSYQNDWHEEFVDDMAQRLLDIVFADAWPEMGTGSDEAVICGSPALDGKRPERAWQWVMNVYTSPLKHPGLAPSAMQAVADALRSRGAGGVGNTVTTTKGSEKGTTMSTEKTSTASISGATLNRAVNTAASRFMSAKFSSSAAASTTTAKGKGSGGAAAALTSPGKPTASAAAASSASSTSVVARMLAASAAKKMDGDDGKEENDDEEEEDVEGNDDNDTAGAANKKRSDNDDEDDEEENASGSKDDDEYIRARNARKKAEEEEEEDDDDEEEEEEEGNNGNKTNTKSTKTKSSKNDGTYPSTTISLLMSSTSGGASLSSTTGSDSFNSDSVGTPTASGGVASGSGKSVSNVKESVTTTNTTNTPFSGTTTGNSNATIVPSSLPILQTQRASSVSRGGIGLSSRSGSRSRSVSGTRGGGGVSSSSSEENALQQKSLGLLIGKPPSSTMLALNQRNLPVNRVAGVFRSGNSGSNSSGNNGSTPTATGGGSFEDEDAFPRQRSTSNNNRVRLSVGVGGENNMLLGITGSGLINTTTTTTTRSTSSSTRPQLRLALGGATTTTPTPGGGGNNGLSMLDVSAIDIEGATSTATAAAAALRGRSMSPSRGGIGVGGLGIVVTNNIHNNMPPMSPVRVGGR